MSVTDLAALTARESADLRHRGARLERVVSPSGFSNMGEERSRGKLEEKAPWWMRRLLHIERSELLRFDASDEALAGVAWSRVWFAALNDETFQRALLVVMETLRNEKDDNQSYRATAPHDYAVGVLKFLAKHFPLRRQEDGTRCDTERPIGGSS